MMNLTDVQIKDLSLTTLQLPLVISNPEENNGLVEQKQSILDTKASLGELDTQNKIFTDHWITVLNDYYSELVALDKTIKTPYLESTLVDGAHELAPHYNNASWFNLVPIVSDNLIGNPTSVGASPSETERINDITPELTKLLTGFTGTGSVETTLDSAYTPGDGVFLLPIGESLPSGDLVIIDSGGISMLAQVGSSGGSCAGEVPPGSGVDEATCLLNGGVWTESTSITPISPDTAFGSGARIRNFHIGFTNAERGQQGAPNYAFDVMLYLNGEINSKVEAWKNNLNLQAPPLTNNGDLDPTAQANNTLALNNVNSILTDIGTWEGTVIIDVNGKYTDTSIPLITSNTASRPADIATRIINLNNNLGVLNQAGDGSVTGSGAYASLYEFVSIRIAKSGGTLFSFFNIDLAISHFDTKIANAQGQLDQYNNTFAIASIIVDTVIGQIDFEVDSVSEFSIGQTIKIMDNDSIVFTQNIDIINGTTITLDSGITAALSLAAVARIVRQK